VIVARTSTDLGKTSCSYSSLSTAARTHSIFDLLHCTLTNVSMLHFKMNEPMYFYAVIKFGCLLVFSTDKGCVHDARKFEKARKKREKGKMLFEKPAFSQSTSIRCSLTSARCKSRIEFVTVVVCGSTLVRRMTGQIKKKTKEKKGTCRRHIFRSRLIVLLGSLGVVGGGLFKSSQ
jgi:hypothetical protein